MTVLGGMMADPGPGTGSSRFVRAVAVPRGAGPASSARKAVPHGGRFRLSTGGHTLARS
jgi:hypothetical protein